MFVYALTFSLKTARGLVIVFVISFIFCTSKFKWGRSYKVGIVMEAGILALQILVILAAGRYTLSLMVGKPSIFHFGAIEKRHIAAALLLCPEDGARGLFSYLLCFFLLPTTAVPMAALPLTSIRTTSKAGLLVSPVCGMVY